MTARYALLAAALALAPAASAQSSLSGVLISEVLADPPSSSGGFDTDMDGTVESNEEFVEVYNSSGVAVDISGWEIWGDGASPEFTFPGGTMLASGAYAVVYDDAGTAPPPGTLPANYYLGTSLSLANSSDNLYLANPSAGASGEYVEVRYGSTDAADSNDGILSQGYAQSGTRDYAGPNGDGESVQRFPSDSDNWVVTTPTPGAATPGAAQSVADVAGWRLLSAPVAGLTVTDLAEINLVQGLPAGSPESAHPAQYPGNEVNLYTAYTGGGTETDYTAPAATDDPIEPGQGFYWYFFDLDIDPSGSGGTSQSFELSSFTLAATGTELTTDVVRAFPENADNAYMIGNPFPDALDVSGISVQPGATISNSFFAWDPNGGPADYVELQASLNEEAAAWQGLFVDVTGTGGSGATVTYAVASTSATPATFYGRSAPSEIAFRLVGTHASGTVVGDRIATVRFLDEAESGWDRFDAGDPTPPTAAQGRLAVVGPFEGGEKRHGVRSLPSGLGLPFATDLAFLTNDAGTFEISWDLTALPQGWIATLRDRVTGSSVDLATASTYAFDADATDWTNRFELSLASSSTSEEAAPASFLVGEAFPNPTSGEAQLMVRVDEAQAVRATVHDALGRQVAVAFDGPLSAGVPHAVALGADLAAGVYVVRIQGEGFTAARQLVVVR